MLKKIRISKALAGFDENVKKKKKRKREIKTEREKERERQKEKLASTGVLHTVLYGMWADPA
jgi:hypothetical protein